MTFIYHNPATDQVLDQDPQDLAYTVWSTTPEIVKRLMAGERPKSWDMLLLPCRKRFHELASGSQLWDHISTHTPALSMLLYIALTASSELNQATVMQDVINMMKGIVAQLGDDHALHSTQSLTMVNDPSDPEGLPIPIGTLADELDSMLSESFFGFTYADLGGLN